MPQRPKTVEVHPQTLVKGKVVRTKTGRDEVVRSVSVVLHLANGMDEVYPEGETVKLLAEQPDLLPEPEEE